jgi:hypothetical protein
MLIVWETTRVINAGWFFSELTSEDITVTSSLALDVTGSILTYS